MQETHKTIDKKCKNQEEAVGGEAYMGHTNFREYEGAKKVSAEN